MAEPSAPPPVYQEKNESAPAESQALMQGSSDHPSHVAYPPQVGYQPPPPAYALQQGACAPPPGTYPTQQGVHPTQAPGTYQQQGVYPPPGVQYQPGHPPGGYHPQQPAMYPHPGVQYHPGPGQPTTAIIYQQAEPLHHNDYLGFSIFTMLCCCFCIGLAALFKSLEVQKANIRGDPNAKQISAAALRLNKIGLGLGIAINVIMFAIIIVVNILPLYYFY